MKLAPSHLVFKELSSGSCDPLVKKSIESSLEFQALSTVSHGRKIQKSIIVDTIPQWRKFHVWPFSKPKFFRFSGPAPGQNKVMCWVA